MNGCEDRAAELILDAFKRKLAGEIELVDVVVDRGTE